MVMSKGIPGLLRVDHVGKTVPNLEQAFRFFIDVLGCEYMYTLGPFQSDENWMKEHLSG
jgi:glyoxylase I family protein